MYRIKLLLACFALSTMNALAQPAKVDDVAKLGGDTLKNAHDSDTSWTTGGLLNINFSQVALSNWAPGGESSYSIAGNFAGYANYAKDRIRWDNSLLLSYALQNTSSNGLRKTDDQIDLTSKFGYRMSGTSKWYYSALFNFKSQFAYGYSYPNDSNYISKFMSPAFAVTSIGATWRPTDYFEVLLSPVASKLTIVRDQDLADLGSFGVEGADLDTAGNIIPGTGKNIRSELGAYINARFRKEIMTNVTLASRLELFNNYTDEDKDNRTKIDVNWETGLFMKVNKYITASLVFQVVYDANVIERTQYRQVLGVGLGYNLRNR